MNISEVERRLFIFLDFERFLNKDEKHKLIDKYFERFDNTITAFFIDGYGMSNIFIKQCKKEELDDIETKLIDHSFDKGLFGPDHFIQRYIQRYKKIKLQDQ